MRAWYVYYSFPGYSNASVTDGSVYRPHPYPVAHLIAGAVLAINNNEERYARQPTADNFPALTGKFAAN